MGLTSWQDSDIQLHDTEIAKNYLSEDELDALNKIVSAYLDIAEVHALNKEPMYMKDWIQTIDDYLKMTKRDILENAGKITHKTAIEKAHAEFGKYKKQMDLQISKVEKDYLHAIDRIQKDVKSKQ